MNKKFLAAIGFISVAVFVNNTFANVNYSQMFTVGSSGSTKPKASFSPNEKPTLYLKLPDTTYDFSFTETDWDWLGDEGNSHSPAPVSQAGSDIWVSFSDEQWTQFNREGEWHIDSISTLFDNGNFTSMVTGSTTYTVTPEPVSTVLFLSGFGAFALAGSKRRKRR